MEFSSPRECSLRVHRWLGCSSVVTSMPSLYKVLVFHHSTEKQTYRTQVQCCNQQNFKGVKAPSGHGLLNTKLQVVVYKVKNLVHLI